MRTLALLILLAFATVASACADPDPTSGTVRIAWIPKESGNQVFDTGLDGARLRARELSQTTDQEVSILYAELGIPTSAADVDGQVAALRAAAAEGADVITISCSGTALAPVIDEIVADGTPVMSWDSDCLDADGNPSDRFTYFGIDNYTTGQTVTQLAEARLTELGVSPPWRVGILSGVPLSSNLQERVAGMWSVLKDRGACTYRRDGDTWTLRKCWRDGAEFTGDPDSVAFHVYEDSPDVCPAANTFDLVDGDACATAYCYDDSTNTGLESSACAPIMNEVTTRVRDGERLQAFFLVGLWPTIGYYDSGSGVADQLADYAARMNDTADPLVSITYDTLPYQLDMLRAGLFDGLVGQKYWAWGYEVTQMAYDTVIDGRTFDPAFVDSGADVVCANNVEAMSQLWSSGNFNQAIPPCSLLE